MRDDPADGTRVCLRLRGCEEPRYRTRGELRHGRVEEVAQLPVALLETQPVAIRRDMQRVESMAAPATCARCAFPDRRGGAVAEEAGADEDAGIIVEVEGGGADFQGDAGDGGGGLGGEDGGGGAERGDGGAAAEADEVLEEGVGAEVERFRDVAGEAGAEVAGAGADEERVELIGAEAGLGEGGGERAGGEGGAGGAEEGVEFVGGAVEDFLDFRSGEVAGGDAVVAAKNVVKNEMGAAGEAAAHAGFLNDLPALGLGVGGGRDGGGEGVEIHERGARREGV